MITTVNIEKQQPKQLQYVEIYGRLNNFIEAINDKIVNRIQIVKHTYLDEYKEHMKIMATELKDIKEQIDEARLKERANEKMFILEEERDYFRYQVSKLDTEVRKLNAQIKTLKKTLVDAKDEISNYKKICFSKSRIKQELEENASKLKSEVKEIYSTKQNQLISSMSSEKKEFERNAFTTAIPRVRSSSTRQLVQYNESQKTRRQPLPIETLLSSRQFTPQTSELQEILAECIKQMKKEIFYRNLKPEDLNNRYFQQDKQIPFQKFSKSDKKQLLYRFLGNPQVLEKFYNFVFQRNEDNKQQNAFSVIKSFDSKFNRANLNLIKKKFDQRIKTTKSTKRSNYVTLEGEKP